MYNVAFFTFAHTKVLILLQVKGGINGSFHVLAWLPHIARIRACSSVVNMHISICGCQVTRHTYITFVSTSVLSRSVCHSLHGAGPVSACVWFCSCPTYMLWSSFGVLRDGRRHRDPVEHKQYSFAPLPFFSFYPTTSLFPFSLLMQWSSCCLFINFF